MGQRGSSQRRSQFGVELTSAARAPPRAAGVTSKPDTRRKPARSPRCPSNARSKLARSPPPRAPPALVRAPPAVPLHASARARAARLHRARNKSFCKLGRGVAAPSPKTLQGAAFAEFARGDAAFAREGGVEAGEGAEAGFERDREHGFLGREQHELRV